MILQGNDRGNDPDLLQGSRPGLWCKGSSRAVFPVSLEGPTGQSSQHQKHRWRRDDGGNLRKRRKASHQELFRERVTERFSSTIEVIYDVGSLDNVKSSGISPARPFPLFGWIQLGEVLQCCKSTFNFGETRPQSSVSQQQIDFEQEEDGEQGQSQEWRSKESGNGGVESAVVGCKNIQVKFWEN